MREQLTKQLRTIAMEEGAESHEAAYERLMGQPRDQPLSQRERDLRDWGYYFGLAYGIASQQDPEAAPVDLAEAAYEAAVELLSDPLIGNMGMVRAFEAGLVEFEAAEAGGD